MGRDYRFLLWGTPGLLLAIVVVVLTTATFFSGVQAIESSYLDQAEKAFQAADYPTAWVCYDRLSAASKKRPDVLYRMACTANALGQRERALLLMSELAPVDRPGHAKAHLWMARHLLANPEPNPQQKRETEWHLTQAIEGGVEERDEAHGRLGQLYLDLRKLDQAEWHLEKALPNIPGLRLPRAMLAVMQKDLARARQEGERVRDYFARCSKAEPDDMEARLKWAESCAFLTEFAAAANVLEQGLLRNDAHRDTYRKALAQLHGVWEEAWQRDEQKTVAERLVLLERGLAYDASNPKLLDRLLRLTKFGGKEADQVRAKLLEMLAQGKARGSVHLALGIDAWQRGQQEQARLHWEQAHQLLPQSPVIANNLAWLLSRTQPPDLPRALTLIQMALDRVPDNPQFRGTRGHILVKMGKWQEALGDLEASLSVYGELPELHLALATTYEHLGVTALAKEHRRLAEAKRAPVPR